MCDQFVFQHKFAWAALFEFPLIAGDSSLERNWQDVVFLIVSFRSDDHWRDYLDDYHKENILNSFE